MGFALVYLGEHYVVDLLAGFLVAFVAWKLAGGGEAATRAPSEALPRPASVGHRKRRLVNVG